MKEFTCPLCAKTHEVFYVGEAILPPDFKVLLDTKSDHLVEHNGMYLIDKQIACFRGVIEIETPYDLPLRLITYFDVDARKFSELANGYTTGALLVIQGTLRSEFMFFYGYQKGLALRAQFGVYTSYPTLPRLFIEDEGTLQYDQQHGLTAERLIRLMRKLWHPGEGNG